MKCRRNIRVGHSSPGRELFHVCTRGDCDGLVTGAELSSDRSDPAFGPRAAAAPGILGHQLGRICA